jgi:EpsI family protein
MMFAPARIRAFICLILAGLAVAAASYWRPRVLLADTQPKVSLEVTFPAAFGEWVVDDHQPVQLVSPDQQTLLKQLYSDTLSRTYINRSTGARVMLSVAYGKNQSEGTRAHLPEVCYPAQGFQLVEKQSGYLQAGLHSIPVQHILTRLGNRTEPVTYWVAVGDRIALTGPQQKWAQVYYTTRGFIPDGMLVRVSNIDPDPVKAYALHEAFVRDLAAAVSPGMQSRVFGAVPG